MANPMATLEGFPLSVQQARAWLHRRTAAHRAHVVVAIDGPLEPRRVARALNAIVRRHEILRTAFRRLPEMHLPLQIVEAPAAVPLRHIDAPSGLPRRAMAALLGAQGGGDDGIATPPLRGVLVREGRDRHSLVLSLPDLCADHDTLSNLVREVALGYGGCAPPAGEEPLQYVDFSEWQRTDAPDDAQTAVRF